MADLIAQGNRPENRWRRALPPQRRMTVGRTQGAWTVPWDDRISRQHADIVWDGRELQVAKHDEARNPIFYGGRQSDHFTLRPGQHFVIGETTFTLADEQVNITCEMPAPVTEQTFSPDYLKRLRFRDAAQRIDVLSRLPEIIASAASDNELFVRLVNMLLNGIPRATAAAVVVVPEANEAAARGEAGAPVQVLHWDRRRLSGEDFSPSQRLITRAVAGRESVLHVFAGSEPAGGPFTVSEDVDWALATPVEGDACRGWAIYVTGRFSGGPVGRESDPNDLRDDLKFTELTATTLSSLLEVRMLERTHGTLRQFFSPVVLEALAGQDPEVVLAPRETEVSVLFCDLRGFSRESERSANNLLDLLQRVSDALGVTTRHILEQGGVVGDFHGDAAMGFWGWPLPQEDAVERACRAALAIRADFVAAASDAGELLSDFQIGIGIATGRAVAGKIGTTDQVKVTVFGPVVNLASRLETMTRHLRAGILMDQRSAEICRQRVARTVARPRRLAVVRPYGMEKPIEVSELLPPESVWPQLSEQHIAAYEQALDALQRGDWPLAFKLLHQVPADDQAKDFLTVFIAQHNRTPPADWDGVIPLASK